MGASQSTDTTPEINDTPATQRTARSMSGRKQSTSTEKHEDETRLISPIESDEDSSVSSEDESAEEDNAGSGYELDVDADDDDDEEEDEEWNERLAILRDARQLKQWAQFYAHPEAPVEVDPTAKARNYFARASAPQPAAKEAEDETERIRILNDAKQLKELAADYLHPERPVKTTDAFACGRSYFDRPSAPQQEDADEAEEPGTSREDDGCFRMGRNYFTRPSAPQDEDAEERARILEDMAQLKKLAVDYLHPELPVKTTDAFACGRNYFTRPSAEEYEGEEEMDDRDEIMEDMKALKGLAIDYMHPERPVQVDSMAACRNYFERPSAPHQDDPDEETERKLIMEDMAQLKKLAVDYMHPELPVVTTDPFACGRNYFSRPSAPQHEGEEEAEERARILEDMAQLKKL
eukprot:CAMPEP_0119570546 /NCGR_PEP_ID=MMETSP1352-20130426/43670_1 /TAXON_ID=265584 /ORGANISM="Stauroneis constricta, Strain CCMP1120" /LENGTH=407 /DNA_ID=CAMNT_0007620215 /DNA_START=100 /DNA_END=1321 /DNA_ORIENTATION=-